ncbi:acyl-CoA dehydrogenase family protein [Dokdonella fugitiva]|jgi:alkylation response protein AidB-like acyl-CoA dehydrogenase|uniref:Alkylation response protein AidB-like acyl-CoA dehydrogenase n=1 Tax=Dokdonella fugitiva TaxID=328517 RepID=A0A4R2IC22_9GAMM|nr:acyl-CoA dehydrogenase family protein [Dokdonella fugitiva]MBA8885209.1 alkylation response protein AidB-like acyl-CoA dehydrogenase [Dokdonella fugitiva]TCO41702.1 alkylation response protein AidB-like acyl-CoA dehydrogenase [Dokdonella fugitiva]
MDFIQDAPALGNQYRDDPVLGGMLAHLLPAGVLAAIEADLDELGAHAARAWLDARTRSATEPALQQWDAWGARIDRIDLTPAWREGAAMTARYGFVAAGHEATHGVHARIDQFARVYLYHVASEFYTCPLAMSDGAATALKASGARALIDLAVPRLLARDPARLWLSGQWMTETAGGSDVARTGTVARRDRDGTWRLYGRKWFTSAVVGEMALALARPEGAGDGTDALALFLVETRDAHGRWNGIRIDRLKDKLGTRQLPTAEIHLEGVPAMPVGEPAHGVRMIAPMLNVTRTWNAVCALATMRRCLALAVDYARRRDAFGRPLARQPLHRATLASLAAEFEAAFHFVFFVAALLGRVAQATPAERALLRVLTPLAKLWTGRLAVRVASETCEAFGGAGYIENTGIPQLLRDAQVFPIWEGTTNVLALDVLRALGTDGVDALAQAARALLAEAGGDRHGIGDCLDAARDWHASRRGARDALEAGARGFATTLARAFAAAVLARHAAWAARERGDRRALAALDAFAGAGLSRLARAVDDDALLPDNCAP